MQAISTAWEWVKWFAAGYVALIEDHALATALAVPAGLAAVVWVMWG